MPIDSPDKIKELPRVLITATAKEMRSFLPDSADLPCLTEGRFYPWQYKHLPYILLITGIGPINAAMTLGRLLGSVPDLRGVLSVGIAGSFDLQKYPLGSRVLISREIWPEFGLWTDQGLDCKGLGWALGQTVQGKVWDKLDLDPQRHCPCLDLSVPRDVLQAISLSVAGVTGCAERMHLLRRMYLADVENMEGFALAWTCLREDIPFVEVRSVSNLVGSRKKEDWSLPKGLAGLEEIFLWL